jgi:hypothetical protein
MIAAVLVPDNIAKVKSDWARCRREFRHVAGVKLSLVGSGCAFAGFIGGVMFVRPAKKNAPRLAANRDFLV